MDIAHLSGRPGKKGNFIDGCIKRYLIGMVLNEVSEGRAVAGKTVHEGGRENIQVIWIAIMEDRPDDLDAVLSGRLQHGPNGGEIKTAGSFNERPADPVTDRTNIEISQQFVIAEDQAIVLGGL